VVRREREEGRGGQEGEGEGKKKPRATKNSLYFPFLANSIKEL
jgi:hypothetical protein